MFQFDVTVAGNFSRVVEAIGATEAQVRIAAVRAINKTALWIQSRSAREISDETKLKLKLIRQKLRIIKANRETLKAVIMANLYDIKAIKLGAPRRTASGVTIGARKFPGAFVARMPKSGHVGVFKRETRDRLPIQEQCVPFADASNVIQHNVDDEAPAVFAKYFNHEIQYVTNFAQ
jgi:hypothetical protein